MATSFASLELGGELHEHDIDTTIEDLPDEILAKSLLGMGPPFSRRRICKQLRSLFDESCTQLRIQDQGRLLSDPPTAHVGPGLNGNSSETIFQHGDLLSLLSRLPRLDTLLDQDHRRGEDLPWEEMGQILGGQLTRLVFQCDRHPGFLGPLKGCSRLHFLELGFCPIEDLGPLAHCQKLCTLRLFHLDTLPDLGPLSACVSLQHFDLYGCSRITSLKPMELCTNLLRLNLCVSRVSDFSALSSCTGLQRLCLFGCVHLHSLAPLASCRKLQHLDIRMQTIPSLEPIWGLQSELHHLYLLGTHSSGLCPGPPELGPLTRVKHLHLNADYVARFP